MFIETILIQAIFRISFHIITWAAPANERDFLCHVITVHMNASPRSLWYEKNVASTKIVSNWSVCSNDLKKYRFFFMETNKFDSFPLVLVTVICEIEHVILATVT